MGAGPVPQCLGGVRVLELARQHAGPRAGMALADLGAEVVKIEPPGGEETRRSLPQVKGVSVYFAAYNRGKKSVTLDLRSERGKQIFVDLVPHADVVLENFRPGVMAAMGFDYERLRSINPRIILTSVSGFGQEGPYRDLPAFDSIVQAMSGIMHLNGLPVGQPVMTAMSIIDRVTALFATIGTLGALYYRQTSGRGQHVDCCLMDSGLNLMEIPTATYAGTGQEIREGRGLAYRAMDGYVIISPVRQALWARLFRAMGREDLAENSDFANIAADQDAASVRRILIKDWVADKTVEEVVRILRQAEVPVGPVRTPAQVLEDPHLWAREMLVEVPTSGRAGAEKILAPGLNVKFSETPGVVGPVAEPGEHTTEVLSGLLHLGAEEIGALRQAGFV